MNTISSRTRTLITVLITLSISACATGITSSVDTADNADLGVFNTYAWIDNQSSLAGNTNTPGLINPLNESRIRSSIDDELKRKGYRKVPLANADLSVAFTLGARDRVRIRNNYDSLGYNYYGYYNGFSRFGSRFNRFGSRFNRFGFGPRFGVNGGSTSVRTITEGTLVVDIFDNKEMEALWHGSATKRLARSSNGQELIADAVGTLLGQFPDSAMVAEVLSGPTST